MMLIETQWDVLRNITAVCFSANYWWFDADMSPQDILKAEEFPFSISFFSQVVGVAFQSYIDFFYITGISIAVGVSSSVAFTMNAKFNIVPLYRATSSVIWRPCRGGDSQIRVHKAGGIANNELTMKHRAPRCLSTARLLSFCGEPIYIFS